MGKQRPSIMIIGEGPTEFYYFNSLQDVLHNIHIEPEVPKHSSLHDLEKRIKNGIYEGYTKIYCVIDMDNKEDPKEKKKYRSLLSRYSKPIIKPKEGINCTVEFFETHRCTEIFFLYYFTYTTKLYQNQDQIIKELNKFCPYKKEIAFFKRCKGLHSYFEKNKGNLGKAIKNAKLSCKDLKLTGRDFTYSQLGLLIEKLMNND